MPVKGALVNGTHSAKLVHITMLKSGYIEPIICRNERGCQGGGSDKMYSLLKKYQTLSHHNGHSLLKSLKLFQQGVDEKHPERAQAWLLPTFPGEEARAVRGNYSVSL